MSRLPQPGGDNGNWGNILNDFLVQSHNPSGSIRDGAVGPGQIQDSAVSANKLSAPVNSILASAQTAVQTVNGKSGNTISIALDDVSDVNLASAADGQALVKNGTSWTPTSIITKSSNSSDTGKAIDAYTGAPLTISGGNNGSSILGFTEQTNNLVTAGTAVNIVTQAAFIATGGPVRVSVAAGTFSAAAAVVLTWDLYDPILSKVIRQSVRTYSNASSNEPIPSLSRIFTPAAGDYVVQFRVKAASNVAITVVESLTPPDESPMQISIESVVFS